MSIVIGNIFSCLSVLASFASTRAKTYKFIMIFQMLDATFLAFSNFFLGAYTAVITKLVSALRNAYCAFFKKSLIISWIIIILNINLSIIFRKEGLVNWIPVLSSSLYSIIVLHTNDEIVTKKICIVSALMWCFHCLYFFNSFH